MNEKIKCNLCGKTAERKGKVTGLFFQVDVPMDYINGLKVTCPKCKAQWFQRSITKNEQPCEKCGNTKGFTGKPHKYYFEVGDGPEVVICKKCTKIVKQAMEDSK